MKRTIVAAAAAVALTLTGCAGEDEPAPDASDTEPAEVVPPEDEPAAESATPDATPTPSG